MTRPEVVPPEVAAFIRAQPADWGYSRLADACRARFGDAAPDAAAIRAWWVRHGRIADGRDKLAANPEVPAFIADHAGRLPPSVILRELRQRFPSSQVPSRTAVYRHVADLLRRSGKAGR